MDSYKSAFYVHRCWPRTWEMNIREEFREAFRQYRRKLGLPLAYPTSEIRIGDLCFFDVDGKPISLGNVLDAASEAGRVSRSVDQEIDPIISNGMRCHALSSADLSRYEFDDSCVEEGFLLSRDKFNVPDYAILASSLIKSEIPYSLAMKWINDNAKSINSLLNQYTTDSNMGLVLVLTQWSAPGYCRIVVPSNHVEEGIVMGLSNGTTWIDGESPEGKQPTLSMIEHYSKEEEATLFINGLSIRKASITRRIRDTIGLSCYSGEREWKKYLSIKKIARGGLASIYTFEN